MLEDASMCIVNSFAFHPYSEAKVKFCCDVYRADYRIKQDYSKHKTQWGRRISELTKNSQRKTVIQEYEVVKWKQINRIKRIKEKENSKIIASWPVRPLKED